MLYYINYNPAEDKRYVLAYDEEKHGMPREVKNQHTIFLYHGAISAKAIYNTEAEALKAWGSIVKNPLSCPTAEKQSRRIFQS